MIFTGVDVLRRGGGGVSLHALHVPSVGSRGQERDTLHKDTLSQGQALMLRLKWARIKVK